MGSAAFIRGFDRAVEDGLYRLGDHAGFVFDTIRHGLEGVYGPVLAAVGLPPFWLTILAIGALGWWIVGRGFALVALAGLLLCQVMGLWPETVNTLALVISAVAVALLVALPIGVLAGYLDTLDRFQ